MQTSVKLILNKSLLSIDKTGIDMFLFINFSLCLSLLIGVEPVESGPNTECSEYGDCIDKSAITHPENEYDTNGTNVGPTGYYYKDADDFGNRLNVSLVDIKNLLSTLTEKHDNYDKIQKDVAFVFQGVIVAVILFGVCAILCVFTACIYCFRISIIDNRLKNDVEALAEKLQRDCRLKKTIKRPPLEPVSESCNIIVGDAGVYCV